MHAYQTQVSQSSDENLNSSEAGQVEVSLSEDQLSAFWAGIVANRDAACRVAARFVSKESAEDIVHTAALLFVEDAQRRSTSPEPFPADSNSFRRRFLATVRNHAFDCVRDSKRPACPVHSFWGFEPEPELGGHNLADRELDTLFARNDDGKYDAPAAASRREQDGVDQLRQILELHLKDLSQAQREILVESFFDEEKRADIAARRGITESTYDNHRQAAFKALRDSLGADAEVSSGIDRSIWYDRVEELIERRAASLRGGPSSKKGKRPNSDDKRGNSGGKRGNSEGERGNFERKRRNSRDKRRDVEGERLAVRGERSNSAHERDNNAGEEAADELQAVTSPGAREEPEFGKPQLVTRKPLSGRRTRLHASARRQPAT